MNTKSKKNIQEELDKRTTPKGLMRYAWDYLRVYDFILIAKKTIKDTELIAPRYFLLCHAIELGIKAFLKYKGASHDDLKKIGHDLEHLLDEIREKHNIVVDKDSYIRIMMVNAYYKEKNFEYSLMGYKELPSLEKLRSVTKIILSKLSSKIDF